MQVLRKHWPQTIVFLLGGLTVLIAIRLYDAAQAGRYTSAERRLLDRLAMPPVAAPLDASPLVRAAGRIRPAVVNVDTLEEVGAAGRDVAAGPFTPPISREGKASGVTISPDGYIVTNNHVVQGASIIRVTTAIGARFEGRVVGADATNDIALLKVEARGLPSAEFGDSDALQVGEQVIAIGNPFGIGTTVTHGIISATDRRDLSVGDGVFLRRALQTDAAISRGNSGGALANTAGQLIGINTAIVSERGANVGIGFAIPSNAVRSILASVLGNRRPTPSSPEAPFVGIVYAALTPEMSAQLELPSGRGVIILEVKPLTPAADAGLRRSDVILAIDGKEVQGVEDVREALGRRHVGQTVRFRLLRGSGSEEVAVRVGRRPDQAPARRP